MNVLQDVRHALRLLAKRPGFTAVAVVTLALGIGATTAIFSVVSAVLLRPLPYPQAERLLSVWTTWEGSPRNGLSPAEFLDYRRTVQAFGELGVWADGTLNVTGAEEPRAEPAAFVSASLFRVLSVPPALGRTFVEEEDRPDRNRVVVLSNGFWRRRLGSSPEAIGTRLVLDGEPHTVVGVMPAGFVLPEDLATGQETQLYVPLGFDPALIENRGSHFLDAAARLRADVDVTSGLAVLRARAAQSVGEFPDDYPRGMRFTAGGAPLREAVIGQTRRPLLLLLGAVVALLLVACANVAALLLSRGEERRRELAVRAALGAGRARLVGTILTESLLLALGGGVVGVALALWGTDALLALRPAELPFLGSTAVDPRALLFALAVAMAAGVLCGIVPAVAVGGRNLVAALAGGRGALGTGRQRLRATLVVGQVALAIVLLVAGGLLARSLGRLLAVDPGYATKDVLTVELTLPEADYRDHERVAGFYRELLGRIRGLPGVRAAGAVSNLPLATRLGDLNFIVEGRPPAANEDSPDADWQAVVPGYFEAMGIPLVRGRLLAESDHERAPGAVVINQRMARLHWPGEDPLGRRFTLGGGAGPGLVTIVGVVRDVRHAGLDAEPRPEMYLPHAQFRFWDSGAPVLGMTLVVRSLGDPVALARAVRREVHQLDPNLPLGEVVTMRQVLAASVAAPRFAAVLVGGFSVLALILAAVGLYALIAYAAARRIREMGLRLALGARPHQVAGLLIGHALRLAAAGVVVGVPAAIVAARLLESLLYGVEALDPLTFAAVPLLVLLIASLASGAPARRALGVQPLEALRQE